MDRNNGGRIRIGAADDSIGLAAIELPVPTASIVEAGRRVSYASGQEKYNEAVLLRIYGDDLLCAAY